MPRIMKSTKNTGIINLLAFSIPLPTPNINIPMPAASAKNCHKLLPNEDAMFPNFPAKSAVS